MEAAFWKKRWETNHIGFHAQEVNTQLEKFWDMLEIKQNNLFLFLCVVKFRFTFGLRKNKYRLMVSNYQKSQ